MRVGDVSDLGVRLDPGGAVAVVGPEGPRVGHGGGVESPVFRLGAGGGGVINDMRGAIVAALSGNGAGTTENAINKIFA